MARKLFLPILLVAVVFGHVSVAQAERLRRHGFQVGVELSVGDLSAAREHVLSSIVLEATNNIVKHAKPGSPCSLTLRRSEGEVVGEFKNVPKMPTTGQGLGLVGVAERLALLNGHSETYRSKGRWLLRIVVPVGVSHLEPTRAPDDD